MIIYYFNINFNQEIKMNDVNVFTSEEILALPVTQEQYDAVSMNRKSTFVNIFDDDEEYSHTANTLEMKKGQDVLFLAEVLRAAELAKLVPINSIVTYKGLAFRLSAVQTSELKTGLTRNLAKKEDFQKKVPPAAPQQSQTAIQPTF